MKMLIKEIVNYLDEKYPHDTAEEYDQGKIGLVIGDPNLNLTSVLFSLDLNSDVILDAINKECNLIITHHPVMFNPISKILFDTELGISLRMLFEKNISVYSMHTNLDKAIEGVSYAISKKVGISDIISDRENSYMSYGKIESISLKSLANKVKTDLELTGVKIAGNPNTLINKVGIIGGSGGQIEEVDYAINNKIDCLITSEIKLHVAQYAVSNGLCLIEINHGAEKWIFEIIQTDLINRFKAKFKAFISEINTDPLIFI